MRIEYIRWFGRNDWYRFHVVRFHLVNIFDEKKRRYQRSVTPLHFFLHCNTFKIRIESKRNRESNRLTSYLYLIERKTGCYVDKNKRKISENIDTGLLDTHQFSIDTFWFSNQFSMSAHLKNDTVIEDLLIANILPRRVFHGASRR